MLPVAIFRHAPVEGPGYFAIFLEQHGIPWRLIAIDAGETVPVTVDGFSGLCFMGGPMSVNDPLPWIEPVCALIRNAVARDVPVVGHCLGGQLMSKALGGEVTRNPVREIGWGASPANWPRFSTGTAKPSASRPAPPACSPAHIAPTRCSPLASTLPCSAMSR